MTDTVERGNTFPLSMPEIPNVVGISTEVVNNCKSESYDMPIIATNNYVGPYIKTEICTDIQIAANQMNHSVRKELKNNLKEKIQEKCYKNYGYIVEIYKIIDEAGGYISAENPLVASTHSIKFSCKLCHPLQNQMITCKIQKITPYAMTVVNGPIIVIISMTRINKKKFFFNNSNKQLIYKNKDKIIQIDDTQFVNTLITRSTFHHGDTRIFTIGFLEDIATEEQINAFMQNKNSDIITNIDSETGNVVVSDNFIDFKEYTNSDNSK
jgi:DNA-directed RNA polymerase subunit E'/Rpb7